MSSTLRSIILALLFGLAAFAQSNQPPLLPFATDPSGACPTGFMAASTASGNLFYCDPKTGVWAQGNGGGGGAPTGPAGGKLSGTYPNPGLAAACSDLSNGATGCSTAVGTAATHAATDFAAAFTGTCTAAGLIRADGLCTNSLPSGLTIPGYLTGLTIGTTAITGGTANRLLLSGTTLGESTCTSSGGALNCPNGFTGGTSGPALTPGTGGAFGLAEGTAPSVGPASAVDVIYSDSTQHGLLANFNNAGYLPLVQGPASNTTGHFATWSGTNGGKLVDGGAVPASFATLGANTFTGQQINSLNGALSTPPMLVSGTWVTSGGTSTTTKPQVLIECNSGTTTSTAWSTGGTGVGVNACTGFNGNYADFQLNGVSRFSFAENSGSPILTLGGSGPSLNLSTIGIVHAGLFSSGGSGSGITIFNNNLNGAGSADGITMFIGTASNSSGLVRPLYLRPTYNQSGTAAASDFVINRTETAIGSGAQLFVDMQVGGVSKFQVDHTGAFSPIPVLTANLKTCTASTGVPWRDSVSDATAPAIGVVLTGGGAVFANVHCSLTTGTYIVDGI